MGNWQSRAPPIPPPSPESSPEAQLYLEHLYRSVFENDLLLEKILSILLLLQKPAPRLQYGNSSTTKLSHAEARILRQVSRRWNLTVSSIFLQCRQPLLHLRLTSSIQYWTRRLVDGFERSTLYSSDGPSSSRHSLPPFSLRVERGDSSEYQYSRSLGIDNVSLFKKLVVHLNGASSLIQLDIQDTFFADGCTPWLRRNFRFSVLQKIAIDFTFSPHRDRYDFGYNKVSSHSTKIFDAFLQNILDRSPELQEVSINQMRWRPYPVYVYPQTLKRLQGRLVLSEFQRDRKLLPLLSPLQPPLHHLTTLEIMEVDQDAVDHLYKILSDPRICAWSLEHLTLQNPTFHYWAPASVDLTKFPVCPRLKTLTFGNRSVLLGRYDVRIREDAIENFLSGRYRIPWKAQPLNGWRQASSRCPSLTSLKLHLGQIVADGERDPTWRPISLEKMCQIQCSFSCVAHLSVQVGWDIFLEGSRNLFRVMGAQLKSLTVKVRRYFDFDGGLDDLQLRRQDLDALFLGITPKMAKRLRWQTRGKWEKFLEDEEARRWSIRNLSCLQKFSLKGEQYRRDKLKTGFVSELALRLAFLQMPALKQLTLEGSFAVSKKCERLWSESGGGDRVIDNLRRK